MTAGVPLRAARVVGRISLGRIEDAIVGVWTGPGSGFLTRLCQAEGINGKYMCLQAAESKGKEKKKLKSVTDWETAVPRKAAANRDAEELCCFELRGIYEYSPLFTVPTPYMVN